MLLSEFINKTEATFDGVEWTVTIPLYDGTTGKLFIKKADSAFEAKEFVFIYLNNYFKRKKK